MPSVDLFDDAVGIGGPDEGLGALVVLVEVAVDRGLEVDQRVEGAAVQAAAGERGEEGLDGVDPGAGGRREVEGPARVTGEPGADLGVLVGGVVVEDRVDQLAGRHGGARRRLRKRMNSWCRCRAMHWPMTLPSSTFSAANRVVVPWRM